VRHGCIQLFAESISKNGLERTEANINYVMSIIKLVEDSDKYVCIHPPVFLRPAEPSLPQLAYLHCGF
jgi:hypothetical protein